VGGSGGAAVSTGGAVASGGTTGGSDSAGGSGGGSGGVPSPNAADALAAYEDWKAIHLEDCGSGVQRVRWENAKLDATVSEGIGYGMLLTVGHGDRAEFDGLWAFYKSRSSGGLMGWKGSGCDSTSDPNSASDGDLDAAMGLLQAACKWGGTYLTEATTLIANIKAKETIEGGENYLKPASSGLDSCQNNSYASPAYYRAFAKKKPDQAAFWNKLATDSYTQLTRAANGSTGLVPNWANMSGGAGCNGYANGDRYGYDAARTPWRVAVDYVWNGTPAAKTWLTKLVTWVDGPAGGITAIGDMYTLSGTKESPNHNSTFTGAFALAAMSQSQAKADVYGSAFRAISDGTYYEESLRAVYMLLASGLFLNVCD